MRQSFNHHCILTTYVTSILQPIDQSVIAFKKKIVLVYKEILHQLHSAENNDIDSVLAFYKKTNFKDTCFMIVDAWNPIETHNTTHLGHAWNNLLKELQNDDQNQNDNSVVTATIEKDGENQIIVNAVQHFDVIQLNILNINGEYDDTDIV